MRNDTKLTSSYTTTTQLILFFTLLSLQVIHAHAQWGWFGSKKSSELPGAGSMGNTLVSPILGTTSRTGSHVMTGFEFDIETAAILGQRAPANLVKNDNCWSIAFASMHSSCREILKDEEKRVRLALRLLDCYLKLNEKTLGLDGIRGCKGPSLMHKCLAALTNRQHNIYVAFYVDGAAMCHYLQSQEFNHETESLVNQLKVEGQYTQNQLKSLGEQIVVQHGRVLETTEHVLNSQKQLLKEHVILQANIDEGMKNIQEASDYAAQELKEVGHIQKDIANKQQLLSETLVAEFNELQRKSNVLESSMDELGLSVEDLTQKSLLGQAKLLLGQEDALAKLKGTMMTLNDLENLQNEAIQESRMSVQSLAIEAFKHREETRTWQMELSDMHRRLHEGSANMLKAQEAFVMKQSSVFQTLEKLFNLHHAILLESRVFKTVLVYFSFVLVVIMVTTTKYTQNARLLLFFGLFVTFTYEVWMVRFRGEDLHSGMQKFAWPPQKIWTIRYAYMAFGLVYLLYSFFSYRDYQFMNHGILRQLQENMSKMQGNMENQDRRQTELIELLQQKLAEQSRRHENRANNYNFDNCDTCDDHRKKKYPERSTTPKTRHMICVEELPKRATTPSTKLIKPTRRTKTAPY